eukprot:7124428-Karenia_brevis.AAC.1
MGIKQIKAQFQPKMYERAMHSKTIKHTQHAEVTADYLQDVQWGKHVNVDPDKPTELLDNTEAHYYITPEDIQDKFIWNKISLTELHMQLKKMKNNKASGPDSVDIELIKMLDSES